MKKLSKHLIDTGIALAEAREIPYLLVNTPNQATLTYLKELRDQQKILWLQSETSADFSEGIMKQDLVVPSVSYELAPVSRIRMGIFIAYIEGFLDSTEQVVCFTSQADKGDIDTLLISSPKNSFPWIGKKEDRFKTLLKKIPALTFVCLLKMALKLAKEGREGKPIGTMFVLGEPELLKPYTEQLILNPLSGHLKKARNIRDPEFFETVRELSSVDGGFLVSPQGVALSAGTYFHSPSRRTPLKKGLGARHAAAAFVTKHVACVAAVISSSSSKISIYFSGKPILEVE